MQAFWMLAASLFFASMAVCVKFASASFNAAELVFYRGLVGMLLMWLWARSRGEPLTTRYPGMHAWRSMVGVLSLGAWFYALGSLPLATAMTLNYMSSVWIAAFLVGGSLLAWTPRNGTPLPPRQGLLTLTVLAGFAGVVLMLRPSIEQNQAFAGLVGLLSGLLSAFAYMQVMALGKLGEPESRTVFYFAAGSTVAGGLAMLIAGTSPWIWKQALWLLPLGVLASLGQLCMTRAYSRGATLLVANLQYSGIVFGALYSLLLFGDRIPLLGWTGMVLIVASGITATVLRARAAPDAPGEEH
jgi:drug/metabolite transporter (DMT)-like permease